MKLPAIFLIALCLLSFDCEEESTEQNPLETALKSKDPKIKTVMDQPEAFEVQILFTRIERHDGKPMFTDYSFQLSDQQYFYPASTVKLPISVLALEKLNAIDTLDRNTRYFVEGDTLVSTFADDIRRIFAVSDNDANNRLFEFLGQDLINHRLQEMGIGPVRISHRLGVHSEEMTTKPLLIYLNDSTTTPTLPITNTAPQPLALQKIRKGKGFYDDGALYLEPFDFSLKNYYPLRSQHAVLKRVIFPQNFREDERFQLSPEQYKFLLGAMGALPREAGYDESEFYDSYCKFFMFGDLRERIPPHVRIYNKVGFAYGTLTDCAYIKDMENNVEFLVSATILVNSDGIFNDDLYEYEEIGIPFLAALGRELHKIESSRKN